MTARFAGKVIIVTGSGRPRGLGQSILQRFADEGAICVVSDVGSGGEGLASSDDARAVVADLEARGGKVLFQPCDVSDEAQCEALVAATVAAFGRLDLVSAGGFIDHRTCRLCRAGDAKAIGQRIKMEGVLIMQRLMVARRA